MKHRDVDRLLAAHFEQTAPPTEPAWLVDRVLEVTREVEPAPPWVARWRSLMQTSFRGTTSSFATPLAAAVAVVVLVAGAALFVLNGRPGGIDGPGSSPTVAPTPTASSTTSASPARVVPELLAECATTYASDAATVTPIPLAGPPGYATGAAGSVWVATTTASTVDRIDPATNTVIASIPVAEPTDAPGGGVLAVASVAGVPGEPDQVWAAVTHPSDDYRLVRIDPDTNEIAQQLPMPWRPYSMVIRPGTDGSANVAWLSDYESSRVGALDLESGEVLADIAVPDGSVQITLAGDEIWAPNNNALSVTVIDASDPARGIIATHPAPLRPTYLATDGNATVWGTNGRGSLFTFASGRGTERHHYHNNAGAPNHVTSNGANQVYVNTYYEGRPGELVVIDAAARCIAGRFVYPEEARDPWVLSFAEGSVWAGSDLLTDNVVRFEIPPSP